MKLHIVLWKWTQRQGMSISGEYTAEHVNVMEAMLHRNLERVNNYRIVCVTDNAEGISPTVATHPLWNDFDMLPNICGRHLPSCYRRLKLFDPFTQKAMGIERGDRIVSIDLDTVIVKPIDHLVMKQERFVGWVVRGSHHVSVFNGSMWMFTAGDLEDVWTEFEPQHSPHVANKSGYLGSDQSWISYKLAKKEFIGSFGYPYIVSYPRDVYRRPIVPRGTNIVMFHGRKKPWHEETQRHSPWVKEHWRL